MFGRKREKGEEDKGERDGAVEGAREGGGRDELVERRVGGERREWTVCALYTEQERERGGRVEGEKGGGERARAHLNPCGELIR